MKKALAYFDIVGESYHKENIKQLGYKNEDYSLSKSRLLEEYDEGDTIEQYEFDSLAALVEREPENPHDANAVKVSIDGRTVGYISRKEQYRVEPYLDRPGVYWEATITNGPFKEIVEDDNGELTIERKDFDFSVSIVAYEYVADEQPILETKPEPKTATIVPAKLKQSILEEPAVKFSDKNHTQILIMAIFLGFLGIHRFAVGKTGTGVLWLLTAGLFGIGWFVDVVWLLGNCFDDWNGAEIVSAKGKNRFEQNGRGAQHNAVPEIFCYIFTGISLIVAVGFIMLTAKFGMNYTILQWYFAYALAVCYPALLAWVISGKGLE